MNLEVGSIEPATSGRRVADAPRQPSRAKLRARLYISLAALDALCIIAGFYIASLLYEPGSTPEQWLAIASILLPIYLATAVNGRAYATEVIEDPGRGVKRAAQAFVIAACAFLLLAFHLKASGTFSRVTVTLGSGITLLLLSTVRATLLRKARRLLGGNPYNVILINDGGHDLPHSAFSRVVVPNAALDPTLDCPEMFDRLAMTLKDADRVVVACSPERRMSWVRVLKGAGVRSEVLAPELIALSPLGIGHLHSTPTLVVADGPLSRVGQIVKRGFDIVVASVALILLAPLLLVIALLIKLDSKGPVFFVQTRIGLGNGMFRMLKFRSMRSESSDGAGATSTRRDDDRVTRVGRFIRKTSIDELPQLLNVLSGDMSIVGPRPHPLGSRAKDKLFWEIDERYWHRHAAKPGLTGLAQVRGYRGATMVESDLTDRLQADLEYLRDWSIWKDIKIVMLTFGVIVHNKAY